MSSINSVGNAHSSARSASCKPADFGRSEPAPWKRTEAAAGKLQAAPPVSPDKLPPWMAAAAQKIAGVAGRQLPGPYNLGVYIGQNIRTFIDDRGDLRADVAALLQHPAVLAAAAMAAPRIIGALAINQMAFNAPPQVEQLPPI